jgi:Icc protein
LLHDLLAPLKVPIYCLPGNHDNVNNMRAILDGECIISAERILRDNWQLIMVASSAQGETGGEVSDLQLFAIEKHLQQYPDMPTLVGIHHPPVSLDSPWLDAMSLHNKETFLEKLSQYPQVKTIVFGHAHQAYETSHQHIRILGTPSTCTQFKPASKEFALDTETAGYRMLDLYDNGKIDTTIVRLEK